VISNNLKAKKTLPSCVIMAGGVGRRLGNITKSTPKPAIKINKVPYIIYLLNWLKKNGFKKFYFLLSFKKDKLEKIIIEYFKKNKNLKFKILSEKRRCGTYSALVEHIKELEDSFFYTNADEIGKFNIKNMYQNFLKSKTDIMSCVIKTRNGNFNLDKKNEIIRLGGIKKFKDCGYKFISKKVFKKKFKKYKKVEDFLYQKYIKKNNISYYKLNNLPLRIDTANDIRRAKLKLKK
tara:strand:- start:2793 stop:3497 length:705 start_codon:yes stop_codon:yes gene_type:complete